MSITDFYKVNVKLLIGKMNIAENINYFLKQLEGYPGRLVAISKTKSESEILEAYYAGQRIFGENKVQELIDKYEKLPIDIEWHMVGHLQTNKVKFIAPFVSLIHAVDSWKLLKEINKQGEKNKRIVQCLLQIHIAEEETKFGLSEVELFELLNRSDLTELKFVSIVGLMGMATYTDDEVQIRKEFKYLNSLFNKVTERIKAPNVEMKELSMGMTGDYQIALQEGSTLVRIGTAIFGERSKVR